MNNTRRSIRARLTWWYSAILFLGLFVFGGAIWVSLSISLRADLDSALRKHAQGLERYLTLEAEEDEKRLPEEMEEFSRSLPADYLLQVNEASGKPLVSSGSDASAVFYGMPEVPQQGLFRGSDWHNTNYRIYGEAYYANGRSYRLYLAAPTSMQQRVLNRLAVFLLWAIPGVVLMAAWGGYWLSRRALTPVAGMTEAARTIGYENLSTRLEVPQTADELQALAETWNSMLARISASAERVSRFTADASHEIRTPLALIRTTAEHALRRDRSPQFYRDALESICIETDRLARLLEDLLFLARADAGTPPRTATVLDLRLPVEAAVREIIPKARAKQIALNVSTGTAVVPAMGDNDAVRRLVLALLENGVKYTPEGGNVRVEIRQGRGEAVVTVQDNGIGINAEAAPYIFDRFYRADPSRENDGTSYGLGLSIAQTIAKQQECSIDVKSEPGNTVFLVRFRQQASEPHEVGTPLYQ